jgi:hypothetical protein
MANATENRREYSYFLFFKDGSVALGVGTDLYKAILNAGFKKGLKKTLHKLLRFEKF